jgi:uncharacterized protein (DUF2062 family)
MPRRLLKKFIPAPQFLRERWFLRPFGERLHDRQLWSMQRRSVTPAFGAGLAICFVPLPVHLLLACTTAMVCRLNIAVICATTFLLNPFTAVPAYYAAYRVGAALMHAPRQHFRFVPTLSWFRHGLVPVWKPFVLGCLVCAVVTGVLGWLALEILWRAQVGSRYRRRRAALLTAPPPPPHP